MKAIILTTGFGFIAMDVDNNIITYKLFDDNINSLKKISKNELTDEIKDLIDDLKEEYDEIIIEGRTNPSLYASIDDNIQTQETTSQGIYLRENFNQIITNITDFDDDEIRFQLNNIYNQITKDKIRESVKTNDVMIVETINSLEELEESTGKHIERLRQWCMPYLPELDKIHNHELYTKIIATQTTRENIRNSDVLESTGITLSDDYDIVMDDNDIAVIKDFASTLLSLYETKSNLEKYIQKKTLQIAPNLYDVAGANLAAKLIAHCNGLENLAKLPSSTVQIIGAEKAIFRHLKTGEKPPKHGLIFQHPSIRGSNWWVRGKLARAVAGKITIAARRDAFTGQYDSSLKEDLDQKIEKIKKDHPFPERKNKKSDEKMDKKKSKKSKKDKRKKSKRNKRKLKKGEYSY